MDPSRDGGSIPPASICNSFNEKELRKPKTGVPDEYPMKTAYGGLPGGGRAFRAPILLDQSRPSKTDKVQLSPCQCRARLGSMRTPWYDFGSDGTAPLVPQEHSRVGIERESQPNRGVLRECTRSRALGCQCSGTSGVFLHSGLTTRLALHFFASGVSSRVISAVRSREP